jgi:hypothetical protein
MDPLVRKLKDAYESTQGVVEYWQGEAYLEAIARIQKYETSSNNSDSSWINDHRE